MTVSEELDALHGQFPACGTVAYADLAAGMVLVANSQSTLDRHALDKLCAQAGCLLGGDGTPPLGAAAPDFALARETGRLLLAFKSPQQPTDALLCLAAPELDLAAFQIAAQACLVRISAEG
ncbi:hypothetical protein [Leisingera sp. S232]|uniref:hypothetical protein n=1 Tax=Leisingera sp. S232 TaxID=3415132 RepID=UPI00086F6324|nr:hypothetical protein AB838_01030 [Rhodobacteraceae bacterium (ex Bugula neritina AB1)]